MRSLTIILPLLLLAATCRADDPSRQYRIIRLGQEFLTSGGYRITLIDIEKPYDRKGHDSELVLGPLESNAVVIINARKYTVAQIKPSDTRSQPRVTLVDEDGIAHVIKSINEGDLDAKILPDDKIQFIQKKNE